MKKERKKNSQISRPKGKPNYSFLCWFCSSGGVVQYCLTAISIFSLWCGPFLRKILAICLLLGASQKRGSKYGF